jgi:subtilase family serine protease
MPPSLFTRGGFFRLASFSLLLLCHLLAANAADRQVLYGHLPAAVQRLAPVGRLDGSKRLKLAIGLPLRNQPELNTFLHELSDPSSANYRSYLTPAQFTERFGPAENDYQALVQFAKAHGLTVTATHPNRMILDVEAAASDIEATFHVTMHTYRHPTEAREFYAPDREPSLDFAIPVLHISGLDNYLLPHPMLKMKPAGMKTTSEGTGSASDGGYGGGDFRAAYVPGTPLTGAGQSVALLEFDDYFTADITAYATAFSLAAVPLSRVSVDGGIRTPGTGNSEVAGDIEMVMSMAPGLTAIYVYEETNGNPWVDILSQIANDNKAKQISCSWGGGTASSTEEQLFQQMATQGQSFFNAVGDSDAFTGAISFPSESVNITQVGATTLTTTGAGGSYASETVWNWGYISGDGYLGSSGGISTDLSIPTWQKGVSMANNQGSTTMRNVPDVAMVGDNIYVAYHTISGRSSSATTGIFGGTSFAAPLWAAFTALVNQQATIYGRSTAGFINPAVYTIGESGTYASAFHDTTTGNNFNSTSPTKFSAVTGYDLCTGWGTPAGSALITALAGSPSYVLKIAVPSTLLKGLQMTGTAILSSTVSTSITVSLLSSAPAHLTVPSSVTIASGSTSFSFTISAPTDALTDGIQLVTLTGSVTGVPAASGTISVLDCNVAQFAVSPINSVQLGGVPFAITVTAQDVNGITIPSYGGKPTLTGSGDSGVDLISPANTGLFSSGIWSGSATLNGPDTNVVLTVNDGAGHIGTSNPFGVVAPLSPSEAATPTVGLSSSGVTLTVANSVLGHTYQLQSSDTLQAGSWTNVGAAQTGNGGAVILLDTDGLNGATVRFYRISVQQ